MSNINFFAKTNFRGEGKLLELKKKTDGSICISLARQGWKRHP